jgi:hypothetical protein
MVSYIFTYRQIENDRYQNLIKVLEWLKQFEFEVVIVEQDDTSKLDLKILGEYNYTIRHIFIKNSGLFNRSWGFNVGIKKAKGDILFFADSDMIVDKSVIEQTIESLKEYDVVSPFKTLIDLTPELTANIDIHNFDYEKEYTAPHRGGINMCSGIVAFNRSSVEKIKGWDERFEGWGGEDDIQFMKSRHLLKCTILDNKCYHLHHTRSHLNGTNQHPKYRNNLNLFYHYNSNQQLLLQEISKINAYGNEYKYNPVKMITYVTCHKPELIDEIIKEGRYNHINHKFLLVGNHPEFESTDRIINIGKLLINIEDKKNLLVYTAWYALVKNNLITGDPEYLRLVEYDSYLDKNIETVTLQHTNTHPNVNLWGHMSCAIWDPNFVNNPTWMGSVDTAIKEVYDKDIVKLVDDLWEKKIAKLWLPTSNILVKKSWLIDFVEWFEPISEKIYENPLAGHGVERATTIFNLIKGQPYGVINHMVTHLNKNSHQTY